MTIYDISLPISESLAVWPGDPPVEISQLGDFGKGDQAIVSRIDMGAHTGTHIDAPGHFIAGGKTVDALDLELLIGPALVIQVSPVEQITASVLEQHAIPHGTKRLLLKTSNSRLWVDNPETFCSEFVALSEDGANWLVQQEVKLVGIDYLSIAPYANIGPAHRALLGASVVVLEGLNLELIRPGLYQLVCLPLLLAGVEGAPTRAILID